MMHFTWRPVNPDHDDNENIYSKMMGLKGIFG